MKRSRPMISGCSFVLKNSFAASLMAMLTTDMLMTKRLLRFHIFRDRDAHAS